MLRLRTMSQRALPSLPFRNAALRELPVVGDDVASAPEARVRGGVWRRARPAPLQGCELVAEAPAVTDGLLHLPAAWREPAVLAEHFGGGGALPAGAEAAAAAYCGHQFGSFAGQLGDGRAMYIGELHGWELQLKGQGPTAFSRRADGRAVLRSSVREFLASEAMAALGVPTTRAGVLGVARNDTVVRDRNYDGNAQDEPVAVVLRVAQSFVRFGSFQLCNPAEGDREGPSVGLDDDVVQPLLDHVVRRTGAADGRAWFGRLVDQTAELAARWQAVGFCHGVLNTDNMSAIGVTIDYGPFGFMERFNRRYVCNSSDGEARYAYAAQPAICKWNLGKLAEALERVLPRAELDALIAERYDATFARTYRRLMGDKLGLEAVRADDDALFEALFDVMEQTASDFAGTFRLLAGPLATDGDVDALLDALLARAGSLEERAVAVKPQVPDGHLRQYVAVARENPLMLYMYGKSPAWLQAQLDAREQYQAKFDAGVDAAADRAAWRAWLTRYRERLADNGAAFDLVAHMNTANPKYVLRNWVAERAIRDAEDKHDYALVRRLLDVLNNPYVDHGADVEQFCQPAPVDQLDQLAVS